MSNQRVAVLSVHTSPMDQPGSGDSGGMNVYIRAVAERLAEHDVEVDLFTRCRGADGPEILEIGPGVRLVTVKAGPCAPVPKSDLPRFLPEFLGGVLRRAKRGRARLRHPAQPLLALRMGRQLREGHPGHPARGVVPHAGEGQELLARPGRGARAAVATRGRGAGDRRRRSDPGADARRGGPARGAVPRRSRAHPDRASRRRPRDLLPARTLRGPRPAAPVGPAARAVRREAPGAQGARRRGPDARGGRGARPRAHPGSGAGDRGRSERDRTGRRAGPADGARRGARRERAGHAVPAAAAGAAGRRVRRRGRGARPVPVGIVRPGRARGTGVRHAGRGRRRRRPAVRRGRRTDRVPGGGARPGRPRRADAPDPPGPGARRPSRGRGGEGGAPLHVGRHGERARRHLPRADGGPDDDPRATA